MCEHVPVVLGCICLCCVYFWQFIPKRFVTKVKSVDSCPADEYICDVFLWQMLYKGLMYLLYLLIDIDECSSDPCQNGAKCTNNVNGYTCNCTAGLEGDNCQTGNHFCYFATR